VILDLLLEDSASDVKAGFDTLKGGLNDAMVRRSAALAAQGRYDEADSFLRGKMSPANLQTVSAWMRKHIKPVKNATTEKLLANGQFEGWLKQHFVPFIKSLA
jgi:hypothetical protein